MRGPIAIVGVPTALGGHLPGMERTPAGLRDLGLLDRLRARPGLAGVDVRDAGDLAIEPGFRPDDDPGRRTARRSATSCRASATSWRHRSTPAPRFPDPPADPRRRLHGQRRCDGRPQGRPPGRPTRHRLVRRARRLQHARHDAVGERLRDAVRDAVRARRRRSRRRGRWADGHGAGRGAVRRAGPRRDRIPDAGRVADRAVRAGMLASAAGRRRRRLGRRGRDAGRRALHRLRPGLPRRRGRLGADDARAGGLALETALAVVGILAGAIPVVGFGATAVNLDNGDASGDGRCDRPAGRGRLHAG